MIRQASTIYLRSRSRPELLRENESGGLPVDSDEAKAAVETVRRRLLEKKRIPLSLARSRFVQKTGWDGE